MDHKWYWLSTHGLICSDEYDLIVARLVLIETLKIQILLMAKGTK